MHTLGENGYVTGLASPPKFDITESCTDANISASNAYSRKRARTTSSTNLSQHKKNTSSTNLSPHKNNTDDVASSSSSTQLSGRLLCVSSPVQSSYKTSRVRTDFPQTPPQQTRRAFDPDAETAGPQPPKSDEQGADLLMYLALSPPVATRRASRNNITKNRPDHTLHDHIRTPPPQMRPLVPPNAPHTPSQSFDFADYVNMTPSPARPPRQAGVHTPLSIPTRRKLTFEQEARKPVSMNV
jgi:hypothetical protein